MLTLTASFECTLYDIRIVLATRAGVTASLLKSPGLFLGFWSMSIMESFGWFPHVLLFSSLSVQSVIWKSDLTDKMKRSFFQTAVVSILLYGCTTWTLTKRPEKKLDDNYTRMLWAILNKSWWQHPTRLQLYGHLPPITKTIQAWRTRHVGHCWRCRDELISDVLQWTPIYGRAKAGRPARTYIQHLCDVAQKTSQRRWTIGKSGERGSGISVLAAHDDDQSFADCTKCINYNWCHRHFIGIICQSVTKVMLPPMLLFCMISCKGNHTE